MTSLPAGWRRTTLGETATLIRNGLFASRPTDDESGTRILRISAVRHGRIDWTDSKFVQGLTVDQIGKYALREGDLLFTRYNGSRALVGISGLVSQVAEPVIYPDKLIRVGLPADIDPRFINLQMESPSARAHIEGRIKTTAGQSGISGADLRSTPLLLPSFEEQRRIVDLVEDHLSRLDAAQEGLGRASRHLKTLAGATAWRLTHGHSTATHHRLSDIAEVRLGRQRSPKNHQGERMRPYLRAANVGWGELRLSDVKTMQFSEQESAVYELRQDDILLTEASGSAAEVGKSALYRGEVSEACFQNTLLRVRCHGADPTFVHSFLLSEAMRGAFRTEARGVGIHHLGRSRLASWPIALPSLDRQLSIARAVAEALEAFERLDRELRHAETKGAALRRAVLSAAFSGHLAGRPSDWDRVEELAAVGTPG